MLSPHKLDDQNFVDIVNRSRRLIQKYAPNWTNENASDPGITILEMLAWLKDNMQYYMDQSHLISQHAYMDLLDIKQLPSKPATMVASVSTVYDPEYEYDTNYAFDTLPKGYPVWADDIRFELSEKLNVQDAQIKAVYCSDANFEGAIYDLVGAFENNADAHPFSYNPKEDHCLYIGFDTLENDLTNLYMDIKADADGYRNNFSADQIEFASGIWEIAETIDDRTTWSEIEHVEDNTRAFMTSGIVSLDLSLSSRIGTINLLKGEEALVWIRYRLYKAEYDRAPILKNIVLNAVRLEQKHTVLNCHKLIEHSTDDNLTQSIQIDEYVPEGAEILLEMRTRSGYKTIDESNYTIDRNDTGMVMVNLNAHHESIDISNLRLISGDPALGGIKAYDIDGLPYSKIRTALENTLFDSLHLEMSEDYNSDKWTPWKAVHSLWQSKSDDRHILFDEESGQFEFGNNEIGMLPDPKEKGLRVIEAALSLKTSGNGNYKSILIDEIMTEDYAFKPITKASGGRQHESMEEAFIRFKKELSKVTRMMSKRQIEEIILTTPGLALRDVSVIPAKSQGENGKIIALPKSIHKSPELPGIYIEALNKQIQSSRLVTENWTVHGPDYIGIKVKLEIIKDPAVNVSTEDMKSLVTRFMEPESGHLFGRRFSVGNLRRRLEALSGVLRVARLSLRTTQGSYKRADGDIQLPPSAIGKLVDFDIQVLDDQGW